MKPWIAKQNRSKIGLQLSMEALRFFGLCDKLMLFEHGKSSSELGSVMI
jgi:hypothetical protein